jgi:hypothetical protein
MAQPIKKLLLVIPIRDQDDLAPVVESEGWHTVKDLFRKTSTSYNTHWNGKFVLDQDEVPWKASDSEIQELSGTSGEVVVIVDAKYQISDKINLFADRDGSVYALESDLAHLLD